MADILCPICNRVNDSSAERCWYCQANLPKERSIDRDQSDEKAGNNTGSGDQVTPQGNWGDHPIPSDEDHEKEVPDWLARIRKLAHEDREHQESVNPFTENQNEKEESSDWLSDLRTDAGAENIMPSEEDTPVSEEPTPEKILPQFHAEISTPRDKDETSEAFDSFLAELGIGTGKPKKQASQPEAEETVSPGENINQEDASVEGLIENRFETEIPPAPQKEESLVEEENSAEPVPAIQGHEKPVSFPWESSDIPQETNDLETGVSEVVHNVREGETLPVLPNLSGGAGSLPPIDINPDKFQFETDDLPDWLSTEPIASEKKPEKPATVKSDSDTSLAGKLERAQLPAWLHAIRPVESMAPLEPEAASSEEEEKEEGILSGIEGVLHTPDLSSQIIKPHVYTSGIAVSSQQQKNAELFASLVEEVNEENPLEVSDNRKSKAGTLLRAIITLLILAAVIVPIFSSIPLAVIPLLYPSEVVNTISEIQALPADKPVLLAAHFEAGLAGELSWSSHSIIQHLLAKNIPLVVISTNSIGSAVMDGEIQAAALSQPGYLLNDQYLNLGYLPGGTLGILSLTRDLRQTFPYTADLLPAWQKPVFQNIYQLSDFGAVIVLTDNADIIKAWVEQAGTLLNTPPILAVVSAQASPMTQPYYDSGQIKGFVAGMNGSLAYEQIIQRPSRVTAEYSSFQITLLVIAAVVFLGGAVALILPSSVGSKKEGGK